MHHDHDEKDEVSTSTSVEHDHEEPSRDDAPLCLVSPMILLFGMITSTLPMQIPSDQSALWQRATLEGLLVDAGLDEVSGLAKSTHGPYLWAHNDSGDAARLMLLDLHGALLANVRLAMKEPYDTEDITIGPCAPTSLESRCLFLGDIGDNRHVRERILVHQFGEPKLPETLDDANTYPDTITPIRSIALVYPEGEAHDAEALMSDPRTGSLYLMTKPRAAAATLYKIPDEALLDAPKVQTTYTLEPISTAWMKHDSHSGRLVTAGEFSSDGRCLLLRTYLEVLTYCKPLATDPWRGILEEVEPDRFTPPAMLQGESLAIDHTDHRIWLTSERRFSPMISMRPAPTFEPPDRSK